MASACGGARVARKACGAANVGSFHDTLARVTRRAATGSALKSFPRALELDGGRIEA